MFSSNQRDMLQAMGFVLYVRLPTASARPAENDGSLWETALGRNIRRHLNDDAIARLSLISPPRDAQAKRHLWRQIRGLQRIA